MYHEAFCLKSSIVKLKVARVAVNFERRVGESRGNNSVQKGLLVFGPLRIRTAHF